MHLEAAMTAHTIHVRDLRQGDVICSERFVDCHRPSIIPDTGYLIAGAAGLARNDIDLSRGAAPFLVLSAETRPIGPPGFQREFVYTQVARLDTENQPTDERISFASPVDASELESHHIGSFALLSHMQPRWFRAKRDND